MTAPAARTDASQRPRPLPIRPRPMTGEGVASYVRRLARANHMRPGYLHRYLKDLHQDETIRFDWLATLAGRSVIALQYALTDPQRPQAGRPAPRRHAGLNSRKTSKAALFTIIRREAREGGLSARALADRHGVGRRIVRQALASPVPPPRKEPPPRKSRLDPFKNAIEDMLRADLDAPRRKRRSVKSIADILAAEHGMTGISNSTVRDHVVGRRGKARRLTT